MKNVQRVSACAATLVVVLSGCGKDSPERLCQSYIDAAKKDEWPAGEDVKKTCIKELEGAKKRLDESNWRSLRMCYEDNGADTVNRCVRASGANAKDDNGGSGWQYGVAAEESGAWADAKPKKLEPEMCNEGAFVIAQKKYEMKLFKTDSERDAHQKELVKSCKDGKGDEKYAAQFACLRKVKSQEDIMKCTAGG